MAGVQEADMKRFWDSKAQEDAFYFVDSRQAYRNTDMEQFWSAGEAGLDYALELVDAKVGPADTVVEIGCGVGRLTRVLARRARRVLAIDISEEMLARARELNPELDNVDWLQGDGTSLSGVGDASADGCVSIVVFQHIPDPAITLGYIREIGRVLRPGGWAAIHVSTDPAVHRRLPSLRDRVRSLVGRAPRGRTNPAWMGSAVELDDVRAAAAQGGLEIEKVWGEGTQYCMLRLRRA
jgi:SAM-dependent methyltransferase